MDKKSQHDAFLEIIHAALEIEPEERSAFISSKCEGDPALLSEVLTLISSSKDAEGLPTAASPDSILSSAAERPAPLSGRNYGQYQILELLGKGGMGEVYRAQDTRLVREVAIKFVSQDVAGDEGTLRRLEREAQMLAALNHPNIAVIYGLEYFGESRLLVMEMVRGETLEELIARGPVEVKVALPIVRQVAEALMAAHDRGVI